jgi:hypothetical protein
MPHRRGTADDTNAIRRPTVSVSAYSAPRARPPPAARTSGSMAGTPALESIVDATRDYEAWVARQVPLVRADIEFKHEQMARAPFPFLRATFYRWVQQWNCGSPRARPATRSSGDIEPGWRAAAGPSCSPRSTRCSVVRPSPSCVTRSCSGADWWGSPPSAAHPPRRSRSCAEPSTAPNVRDTWLVAPGSGALGTLGSWRLPTRAAVMSPARPRRWSDRPPAGQQPPRRSRNLTTGRSSKARFAAPIPSSRCAIGG